jgi:RNA-directed DNA polymerase
VVSLFDELVSFDNLYSAYLKARKGKRFLDYVLVFEQNLEQELLNLQRDLKSNAYVHGCYREMIVNDSKKRLIKVAPFRDRIVHHALCNIIEPIIDKKFVFDSYACRKNKGTHKAVRRLQSFLRKKDNVFCLQCDISKYFMSIDHKVLFGLCCKHISDERVLLLISKIISSSNDYVFVDENGVERNKGIPIGNLTSQLFANLYLNLLDQFVKHKLRVKFYLRYMDDFLFLSDSKFFLNWVKREVVCFLEKNLFLVLNPKKANLFLVKKGVSFLGYVIFPFYKLLRKSTVKRFIKRIKKQICSVETGFVNENDLKTSLVSWRAYAKDANSFMLRKSLIDNLGSNKKLFSVLLE